MQCQHLQQYPTVQAICLVKFDNSMIFIWPRPPFFLWVLIHYPLGKMAKVEINWNYLTVMKVIDFATESKTSVGHTNVKSKGWKKDIKYFPLKSSIFSSLSSPLTTTVPLKQGTSSVTGGVWNQQRMLKSNFASAEADPLSVCQAGSSRSNSPKNWKAEIPLEIALISWATQERATFLWQPPSSVSNRFYYLYSVQVMLDFTRIIFSSVSCTLNIITSALNFWSSPAL